MKLSKQKENAIEEETRSLPSRKEAVKHSHDVGDSRKLLCGFASYDPLECDPVSNLHFFRTAFTRKLYQKEGKLNNFFLFLNLDNGYPFGEKIKQVVNTIRQVSKQTLPRKATN